MLAEEENFGSLASRRTARTTSTVPRSGKNYSCPKSRGDRELGKEVGFRADAAFAKPEI